MSKPNGWIGVDFDGTLSQYENWKHSKANGLGAPVPAMAERVKSWIAAGWEVRIVTARADPTWGDPAAVKAVEAWCEEHLGKKLQVTNAKDSRMAELWDDRAVRVEPNTGRMLSPSRVFPELT